MSLRFFLIALRKKTRVLNSSVILKKTSIPPLMGSPVRPVPLQRGDILLIPFPFTDLSGQKVRPAVIVSPDPQGEDVLVAFISSVTPIRLQATDWLLANDHTEFPNTGLKYPSVFKMDKLLTLHRSLILRRLGHGGPKIQEELNLRLLRAIGLAQ